jgi:uncharacterized damage-inducible protein DinB
VASVQTFRRLTEYSDWANQRLLNCAGALSDEQLDRAFPIGPGSLRKTLAHICTGEQVWLRRWMGHEVNRWTPDGDPVTVGDLAQRFRRTRQERDAFLITLNEGDLERVQRYQDTVAGFFTATLGDMLLQGFIHSTHHRAQAVNLLRQTGGEAPELDYMVWLRRPAV